MDRTARENTRVGFDAPTAPVERADSVVAVLDSSRKRRRIDAIEADLKTWLPGISETDVRGDADLIEA